MARDFQSGRLRSNAAPGTESLGLAGLEMQPYFPGTLRPALFSAYGFSFLSQACDLGFYILLFKFLPLAEVGRFSWVMAVMVFVGLFLDLGISPALTREFSQHKTPLWAVFWQTFWVRFPGLLLSLVLFIVWLLVRTPEAGFRAALFLAGLQQLVRTFTTVFTAWLYAAERQPLANLVSALSSVGRLGVGLGLLAISQSTNVALLFAALVGVEVFSSVIAWVLCHRVMRSTVPIPPRWGAAEVQNAALRSRLRTVGFSFGAITALVAIQNRLDWLLVSYFLSNKALGLYSMANKLYEVARTLVALALSSVFPWMCREKGQCPTGLGVFFKGGLVVFGFIALAGALVGPEVLALMWGQKYAGSEAAIRLLMLGAAPAAFDAIIYHLLIAGGSERFIVWASILATCIQVGLDVLFIPKWGIQGAVGGMVALIVAVGVLYGVGARRQLKALGWYWTLLPLLLAVGGFLIIWTNNVLWHRALLGLCLWVLTAGYPLYLDRSAVFQSIGLRPKLANERSI